MREMEFPKVLVAAPQHESKNYCWEEWRDRAKNLTYPNYDIMLADNSPTKENLEMIRADGIRCKYVRQNPQGLIATINDGHNSCREYALKNGYDYLLHLETDIIPPFDVIERLMNNKVKVCSGLYDIFYGTKRKLMLQTGEKYDRTVRSFRNVEFVDDGEMEVFNGKIQRVYHPGIGCALIVREVLEQIPFRITRGNHLHSDTWFANDCSSYNIPIYIDPTVQCKHLNFTWLSQIDELVNN